MILSNNVLRRKNEVNDMNFFSKIKVFAFISAIVFFIQPNFVSADSFDNFREALKDGIFTIKYQNITPVSRRGAVNEKMVIYDNKILDATNVVPSFQNGLSAELYRRGIYVDNPFKMYKTVNGIFTSDGRNSYTESYTSNEDVKDNTTFEYADCTLIRGNKKFVFKRLSKKNKTEYYGSVAGKRGEDKGKLTDKKNKVSALPVFRDISEGLTYDLGDEAVNNLFNAVLPLELRAKNSVVYEKFKTGHLDDGSEYTDMRAVNLPDTVIFDVIRYYFKNGKPIKIAAGRYFNSDGKFDGVRTIIKIDDFQDAPIASLLKLPADLKDVTGRED